MKIKLLLLPVVFFLVGCEPSPAPQEAIKACVDKGWEVKYMSTSSVVEFDCKPPKDEKNGLFKD